MPLPGAPHHKLRDRFVASAIAVLAAAAVVFVFLRLRQQPPAAAPVWFTVQTPGNGSLPLFGRPTVSPDGRSVLFAVNDPLSQRAVWYLHSFASGTSRTVPGSEAMIAVNWSFDSRSILLRRGGALWTMDVQTGSRQRLPVQGAYSSWQPEGIVTGGQKGLQWFAADGSGARWIKNRDQEHGTVFSYPSLIPGGRWLLYNAETDAQPQPGTSLHLASLDGKIDREILSAEHPSIYAGPGYLLSLRGDVLVAQGLDPRSGQLRGAPTPIATGLGDSGVGTRSPRIFFGVRQRGAGIPRGKGPCRAASDLVRPYGQGPRHAQRHRRLLQPLAVTGWKSSGCRHSQSRDGQARSGYGPDARCDVAGHVRLGDDFNPVWSPDSTRITTRNQADSVEASAGEDQAVLSPDAKWMAYRSNETGRFEVFIRAVSPGTGKWQISTTGGGEPQWRGDGRELFYTTLDDKARVMAVEIGEGNGSIRPDAPRFLFDVRLPDGAVRNRFVPTRDGQRFLAIVPLERKAENSFTVIVNWPSLVNK